MEAIIKTHYPDNDPECHGDYWDVEVFINGVLIVSYGDAYHDEGSVKAEAFLKGYALGAKMPFDTITRVDLADRES